MAQHAKPIDITRSFAVTDPNAFPNNQGFTQGEDSPEKLPQILGFEGYNFIPTAYGYKSFFGANSTLNIQALPSRCDRIFLFQLMNYQNILVALCEDGIWVCFPSHPANTWSQWVVQATPAAGSYEEWTYCVIENHLYCYREGDVLVHKISPTGTPHNTAIVPTTITFGAPYANAEANVVIGTYDITVAQIVAGVPSSVTADAGSITLAAGEAFDVDLGGYIGDAILYFTHQTTGAIYKQTVVGLTVAPQTFTGLTVASTDARAQGIPDPDAFNYITNFVPCTFKNYLTTAERTADTSLVAANVEKIAYDHQTASYWILTDTTPTWRAAVIVASDPISADFRFTLNMAGQKGIFRGNARLGFWDSANSISWSDLADVTDLVPSVTTRAGYAIFSGIKGRTVTILAQGDGFVIYTTKGIVGVRFANDLSTIWEATTISDTAGIAYDREVTTGITDLEHFAYTNTGIKRVGAFNALSKSHQFEDIIPDVFDLLKEQREPVYLDFLNGRFLFLSVINANYIYSKTSFVYNTIDSITVRVLSQGAPWNGVSNFPIKIGALTVAAHIKPELVAGAYNGQYSQWNATGESMLTSRDTAISPYLVDDISVHVPNSGLDLGSTIDTATAEALSAAGTYSDETPLATPYAFELGWTYPGRNNTGAAFLGLTDSYLDEFEATQIAEWDNFITIQAATKAALEAAPASVESVVGSTPYTTSALATAAMEAARDAYAAGIPGSVVVGNTVTSTEDAGTMLSGAGIVTGPTITDAGTYFATWEMSKAMEGGWDITRTVVRPYSVRSATRAKATTLAFLTYRTVVTGLPTIPELNAVVEGNTETECNTALIARYEGTEPATISIPPDGGGYSYEYYDPVWSISGAGVQDIICRYTVQRYRFGVPNGFPYIALAYYATLWQAVSTVTEYFIDYSTTKSLTFSVNAELTYNSVATAEQETLEWAYIPQGVPAGDFVSTYGAIDIPGTGIVGTSFLPLDLDIVYPGSSFLIDNGSPAPIYPTFSGSLVFDTGLKKWGKNKNSYRTIFDMAPINSIDSSINFTNFGVNMAQLDAAGAVKVYDSRPTDSWIRYGKVGYYRQGMTQIQEVRAGFRNSSTGDIIVDTSIDGRALELSLQSIYPFSAAADIVGYFSSVGRWHTITISGQWDLQYLEFRGNSAGRR